MLRQKPRLDVPGMTEFELSADGTRGVPRAELYLLVEDPGSAHRRALENGARELSPLAARGWGHEAAYSLDLDGHVLAFAKVSAGQPPV